MIRSLYIERFALILIISNLIACSGQTNETASFGAGAVTLGWLPPVENNNSTSLNDLSGYNIYYGISKENMSNVINITNQSLSEYVVTNLKTNNIYYFTIASYNSKGIESNLTDIVSKSL